MAKKGVQHTCIPKRFAVPADLRPLQGSGVHIITAIRTWVASINRRTKGGTSK
jgi:hypothetical protein